MQNNTFSESNYEEAILDIFVNSLEYSYIPGFEINRNEIDPLYEVDLEASIHSINANLPEPAICDAIHKLKNIETGKPLLQRNMTFMDYLQNGILVKYLDPKTKDERSDIVYLVDYEKCENNHFTVINQWTVVEKSKKRPDIVVFVNGLPLVVIELKSPARDETSASEGYTQLRHYMQEIPSLFVYNAFIAASDMADTRYGTITSNEDRFMEWKTVDGNYADTRYANFDTFFQGMFEKSRFLDIIKNFICFDKDNIKTFKAIAAYHQYFAVKKAISSTIKASQSQGPDKGKGGVFWHTQGSGKSFSMVFYAHLLQQAMLSPTIVVITDRNDLDNQLFGQFSRCQDFLRQQPVQAESREHLKELLQGRKSNGIIFTTMQKFTETDEPLSERSNIVVMADEAHRSQYGLTEKVMACALPDGTTTFREVIGTARIIRNCLPNATYIGFTGTPISQKDRNTREVFGDYIDIYDMTQAVEDGATKPVYYENRVVQIKLDSSVLDEIDKQYDILADKSDPEVIAQSKKELSRMEALLGADETIDSLVRDIIFHYESYRENLLTGKAMIVAYSRPIAIKIYYKILELRPTWKDKIALVMTLANNDPEEWHELIGNKQHKNELAVKFKDNDSPLKIAIVVDMWLTGFDVPSLATMYIYKPMAGHNLMQAIARVNRVFKDKEGGLVVDYIGIASALKRAMSDYTVRDKTKFGDQDIAKTALPKFREKLEICRELFHGYDYSIFFTGTNLEKASAIKGGLNFILGNEISDKDLPEDKKTENIFIKEALLMKQALSLCSSITSASERAEAAYFEAIRVLILRLKRGGKGKKLSLKEVNDQINDLLKQTIKSEGVINLFQDRQTEFSIFDQAFLKEISQMKEKNLALDMLKKLLKDQVSVFKKTNIVKSEQFSELLQNCLNRYVNGHITNEEVIEELLKMAEEIEKAAKENKDLGLNEEEAAFYDALTKPQAVKDFYTHDELIALTKELADSLRANRTIDWQRKSSARARMRLMVKKLLKKYKYPPEGQEEALNTVIEQCEMWADNTCD